MSTPSEYDSITMDDNRSERGKSKLISPDPLRKKFVTELLHAFSERKISFKSLINLDNKKVRQVSEMGFVKLRHGRYKEARKIFEVLTFVDHKNPFHHLALAGAYQKLNRFVDALYQYTETLKLDKKNINAYVNRGEIYLRHKNFRKAAEDFREAILFDTKGKDLYANRARSMVIAIKRTLEQNKKKALGSQSTNRAKRQIERKKVSPLNMLPKQKR